MFDGSCSLIALALTVVSRTLGNFSLCGMARQERVLLSVRSFLLNSWSIYSTTRELGQGPPSWSENLLCIACTLYGTVPVSEQRENAEYASVRYCVCSMILVLSHCSLPLLSQLSLERWSIFRSVAPFLKYLWIECTYLFVPLT
jgi:hypothetical protein